MTVALETPSVSDVLATSYEREALGVYRAFGESAFLGARDILRAHYVVVDYFISEKLGEGVGGVGLRDPLLLVSAIDRQQVSLGGVSKWVTLEERLATLIYGLVKNHPFHDANKRTALLTLVHQYYHSGRYLTAEKSEVEDILVYLAGNVVSIGVQKLKSVASEPSVQFSECYRVFAVVDFSGVPCSCSGPALHSCRICWREARSSHWPPDVLRTAGGAARTIRVRPAL